MAMLIEHLTSVDSTNARLVRGAARFGDGDIAYSDSQTAGKGTRNRVFHSPPGGLYFSMALRRFSPEFARFATLAIAVSAHSAALDLFGVGLKLRWVNDLCLRGKKVGGILCERHSDLCVIGLGMNLSVPPSGFPAPIRAEAGALFAAPPAEDVRVPLMTRIRSEFLALRDSFDRVALIRTYRRLCETLGRRVVLTAGGVSRAGVAADVDDEGRLILDLGGSTEAFCSGTVRFAD